MILLVLVLILLELKQLLRSKIVIVDLFSCSCISFISVHDFDWCGTQDSLYNLKYTVA
jgi:hypothetical protein